MSVLIEGGGTLNGSALREKVVDRVRLYIAPMLLGGQDAQGIIGGSSPNRIRGAYQIHGMRVKRLGADFCVTGTIPVAIPKH